MAPAVESGGEGSEDDGFAEEVVHTGGHATLAVLSHGAGGEGDDGEIGEAAAPGAEFAGGLVAVEVWHLAVHKDQIYFFGAQDGERLVTLVGGADEVAKAEEHFLENELVDGVVFGEEDGATACG